MIVDSHLTQPHVGYAIGRSFGGAVERNRMRRRLRVLLGARSDRLRPGLYMVGAQPTLNRASSETLTHAVDGLLNSVEKHYE